MSKDISCFYSSTRNETIFISSELISTIPDEFQWTHKQINRKKAND